MDLAEKYYDPKQPGSFQGADKLYRSVGGVSKKKIRDWLSSQETHTLTREFKTSKKRRLRVPLLSLNHQWDIDCGFLPGFEERGYKGFLLCIDVFSRQVHACAIKTTSAAQIIACLKIIFQTARPRVIRSDGGIEFRAKATKQFLDSQNISHYITHNTTQANFAERAIRSIKARLFKYLVYKNSKKWVDVLRDIVQSYNNTYHRSLGRTPASVNENNQEEALLQQYVINPPKMHERRPYGYSVGDNVRIPYTRQKFDRVYNVKWTGEVMTVVKRYRNQNINLYKVEGFDKEPILGSFHEWELQKIVQEDDPIYKIDRVVRTKGRGKNKFAFVSWLAWPSRFNSWVPYDDIKIYKNA